MNDTFGFSGRTNRFEKRSLHLRQLLVLFALILGNRLKVERGLCPTWLVSGGKSPWKDRSALVGAGVISVASGLSLASVLVSASPEASEASGLSLASVLVSASPEASALEGLSGMRDRSVKGRGGRVETWLGFTLVGE